MGWSVNVLTVQYHDSFTHAFQEMLLVPVGLTGVILGDCPQKRLWVLVRELMVPCSGRLRCVILFWLVLNFLCLGYGF